MIKKLGTGVSKKAPEKIVGSEDHYIVIERTHEEDCIKNEHTILVRYSKTDACKAAEVWSQQPINKNKSYGVWKVEGSTRIFIQEIFSKST